jgi:hypothetical protein
MKSLHHREKPITPRMTDTMPLISKDIAKPPDIPGIPGDAPGNPSLGKKLTGIEALRSKPRRIFAP